MAMSRQEIETFCRAHRDVAALLVTGEGQWLSFGAGEFEIY